MMLVNPPEHKLTEPEVFTIGLGFTVTGICTGSPIQPFAFGVIVIVALTGALVLFEGVNTGIAVTFVRFAKPIEEPPEISKVIPLKFPSKGIVPSVSAPLQSSGISGTVSLGPGLTVILKVCVSPSQLFAVGVKLIIATML